MSSQADNSITFWLNNAGRYPRLKQEQIDFFARQMHSYEEGSRQYRKYMNKIVNSNLRLVVSFVNSYMNSKSCRKWGSVDSLDYLQSGSLGLMQAVKKYDPDRGYRFSTYAYNWIYSYVGRTNLQLSSLLKLSEEACRLSYHLRRDARLASDMTKSEIEMVEMTQIAQSTCSLDAPAPCGGSLFELISDNKNPIDICHMEDVSRELSKHLEKVGITEYEKDILIQTVVNEMRPCLIDRMLGLETGETLKTKRDLVAKIKKAGAPVSISM